MIITELSLTNFRGYENATFTFQPGINLIAGVNGAGKSTALDAIRILMSRASREIMKSREPILDAGPPDIRRGAEYTFLSIEFGMPAEPARTVYRFEGQINREDYVPGNRPGEVRDEGVTTQSGFDFYTPKPLFLAPGGLPLCIFFSPHRSLLTQEASTGTAQTSAFAQALGERRFNLRQAAEWWLAQEALSDEHERYGKRADAIQRAIYNYLPPSIQVVQPIPASEGAPAKLLATKDGQQFDLSELSDGERGVLALVFEIARRLAIAYPDLDDPAQEGAACVLIDEIELHLHPQWQRDVLRWLERTFPKCQFIVTTHSPQVIGEVSHDRVHMIGKEPLDQTLGMDSAWILRNVMDTPDRSERSLQELTEVEKAIKDRQPEEALRLVEKIEREFGVFDQLQALRTKAELMLRLKK